MIARFIVVFLVMLATMSGSRAAVAQEVKWTGTVGASANMLYGAARSRLASLTIGLGRADSALELRSDASFSYADSRPDDEPRRVTARSWRVSLGGDHQPLSRLSPFWFGSVEASLQQRIDRRIGAGAGAKWTFYRSENDDDVSTSLAVLWEQTRARDPLPENPAVTTRARWSLRVRLRRQLTTAVRFSHVTFYQPVFDRPSTFTTDSNTSLAVALNSTLSLTASLRDRYDNEARSRGARSNHDGQLLFGLRADF